jgi:nitrite reductase/ring-hydroxylating ferredoxin subunit
MDRADKAMEAGPQKLHCFVDSKELTAITKQLQEALEQVTQVTVKRVARELLGVQGDAALEESRNVRIFIPQDAWAPGRDDYLQFKRERNHGKLTLHGPHTDLWFYHPLNVINVWVAVGPVLQGNGMSFWPHLFGQRPPLGYDGCARDDQVFGEALNFALEPGDALLFHINHLHGSEINQTDQTRFVFSGRFTVGAPKLFDQPWHSYLHLDRVPAELGKHAPPNVTAAAPPATPPPTIDTSNQLPAPVGVRPGPDAGTLEFDAGALAVGEVRPLTDDYCVSRTAAGVFAFGRACPHEGADLAGGFVRAGQVHCPRHNLALNPQTGESSCRSLPRIATVPCVEIGDTVRLALPVSSGWQRFAQEPSARSLPAPCSVAAHGPPDAAELRCQLHELRAKLLQKEMELRMLAGVAEERLQVLQRVDAEAARLRKEIEDAQRLMRSPWKFIVNRVRRLYRRLRTTAVNPAQKADRTPG